MTFDEWLQTDDGKRCMQWPVTSEEYLRNRLWWAFNAGSTNSKFENQEQEVNRAESSEEDRK